MLLDIPTAVVVLLMHVFGLFTPWRVLYFWRAVRAYTWGDNEHELVANHFGEQLSDLPFVIVGGLAAILSVWRAWDLIVAVYKKNDAQESCVARCALPAALPHASARLHPHPQRFTESRYEIVVQHLFMAGADWVCGLCGLVVVCTLIRLPGMIHALSKFSTLQPGFERCTMVYIVALHSVFFLFVDVFSIAQAIAVTMCGVRVPAMLYRLYRVFTQYSRVVRPHNARKQRDVIAANKAIAGGEDGSDVVVAARARLTELRTEKAYQEVPALPPPSPLHALLWVQASWTVDMTHVCEYLTCVWSQCAGRACLTCGFLPSSPCRAVPCPLVLFPLCSPRQPTRRKRDDVYVGVETLCQTLLP